MFLVILANFALGQSHPCRYSVVSNLKTQNTENRIIHKVCFFLQVNRPISMKKDGIQTRKRKPKGQGKARASPKVAAQQRQNNTSPGELKYKSYSMLILCSICERDFVWTENYPISYLKKSIPFFWHYNIFGYSWQKFYLYKEKITRRVRGNIVKHIFLCCISFQSLSQLIIWF